MTFHVRSDMKGEFPTLDYLWHANLRQRRTREAGASKGRTSAGRETFKSLIRTTCSFLLSPENYWPVKPEKRWRLLRRRIVSVPIALLSSAQLSSAQSRSLWPRSTHPRTLLALLSESGTVTKQENTAWEKSLRLHTALCCSPTSAGDPMSSFCLFFSANICYSSHQNAILSHIHRDRCSVRQIPRCRNPSNAVQTCSLSPTGLCVSLSPSLCSVRTHWTACRKQAQIREQTLGLELLGTQRNQRGPSVTRLSALASDEREKAIFLWHVCTRREECVCFLSLQAHAEAAYLRRAELTKGGAGSDHGLLGQLSLGA